MALTNAERQRRYRERRLLRRDDYKPNEPHRTAQSLARFVKGGHLRHVYWLLWDWAHPELMKALREIVDEERQPGKRKRDARAEAMQASLWYRLLGGSLGGWYVVVCGRPTPIWLTPQDGPFPQEMEPDWATKLLQRAQATS